jgi:HK97 family phage prohead protease
MREKMSMEIERRSFAVDSLNIEMREDSKPVIRGHAAVFNQLSEDLGGFREQIAPGAFIEAIERDDVRALFNHDANFVLGRTVSKTLRLSEDARGLAIEIDPPDTQAARDLMVSISRGDVSQMSFGFTIRPGGQDWAKDDDGRTIRTLKKVRLFDVSPVTYPAYPQTDVALREMRSFLIQNSQAHDSSLRMGKRLALAGRRLVVA